MGLLFNRKKETTSEDVIEQTSEEQNDEYIVKFEYRIHDVVLISVSGERGEVIGRAELESGTGAIEYLVRYENGNGCAVEKWWDENAIELEERS